MIDKRIKKAMVLQHDEKDCGVACLKSIIRYYGNDISLEKLRRESGTCIVTPRPPSAKQPYSKGTMRKKCRARAAVEPVIGHTKHDNRMIRNYLKGISGNAINPNLAAAGYNFKGLLRKIKEQILCSLIFLRRNLKFPKKLNYRIDFVRID